MLLKYYFLLLSSFSFVYASAQDSICTKQLHLSAIIAFEQSLNPAPVYLQKEVMLTKNYYPLADQYRVENPLIVQRKAVGYLPLYAEYFYTASDSIVRFISYDWEKDKYGNYFAKQNLWKEENMHFDSYNSEYERIRKLLTAQLGTATTADSIAKTVISKGGNYRTRSTVWESNDIHAELYMIFALRTHRVRFTMYGKK